MAIYRFTKNNIKPKFAFVKDKKILNHLDWNDWQKVSPKDILMKVRSLDFSKETVAWSATGTAPAMAAAMAMVQSDYKEFWDLWNKNRKIPGNIFLHPNGKMIWISDIDLKYFEQIKDL